MITTRFVFAAAFVLTFASYLRAGETVTKTISHGGESRNYSVYIPDGFQPSESWPLVLNLHGTGGTSAGQAQISQMNDVADQAGFLVAYPQATMQTSNGVRWNILQLPDKVDDVDFISSVIDGVSDEFGINKDRVYATGFSNGGSMTLLLGHQMSERFAAVATVAGAIATRDASGNSGFDPLVAPTTGRALPSAFFFGTSDILVQFNGGQSPLTLDNNPPVDDVVAAWATNNGCDLTGMITDLPNLVTTDRSTAARHDFTNCNSYRTQDGDQQEANVVLYKFAGGNHQWPGGASPSPLDNPRLQPRNDDVSASQEMWDFFSQHTLPKSSLVDQISFGEPRNLGSAINSSGAEFGLDISSDGNTIYFNRCSPGCNIYATSRDDASSPWQSARRIAELSTSATEVGPSITADGLELYFSDEISVPNNRGSFRSGSAGGDIWVSKRTSTDQPWGEPEQVAGINSSEIESYPTISPDGLSIYFGSTRDAVSINGDTYIATRTSRDEPFSKPVNIGHPVNDAIGSGGALEVSSDGLWMFFTSYRPGFGQTDIWVTKRETVDSPWQDPENLGATINDSGFNGFPNFSPDERTLYFASSRDDGNGSLDVWSVDIRLPGQVSNCDLDGDGFCAVADLDVLTAAIVTGDSGGEFDLNGDAQVDTGDVSEWLLSAASSDGFSQAFLPGDANLDGEVTAADLNSVALNWRQSATKWSEGDFNADGMVDASDLNSLALNWRESIAVAAAPVPEPNGGMLVCVAFCLTLVSRGRSIR